MTNDFGSADVCGLIIARMDGARSVDWPPGARVYTYGSRPGDAVLVPPPTRTTILVARGAAQRWFDVSVSEVYPSADPAALFDAEIIAALSKRAGNPPPFIP
ncbi:hypothetical protein [Gandjariella thermophila]|uniref:Uncharacterized protein n=1 Tax=Gandjariella thermophila TaxID=1931992 RepID=A0A4D4J5E1_9PSEU|nr:hypothetical protein [Gandjariella thermophila]GDY29197.1 hypothetical protein GTS_08300 [Gandjariella thermophila]